MNEICLRYDLELQKINHIYESSVNQFIIEMMDIHNNRNYFTTLESICLMESKIDSIKDKFISTINAIIEAITKFLGNMTEKFRNKEIVIMKDNLQKAEKRINEIPKDKKVKVYDDKFNAEALNAYIQKMAVLERKVLTLKVETSLDSKKVGINVIRYQEIIREMDKLNKEYEDTLKSNEAKSISEKALKEAIRIADKDLKNIEVDYAAVEKNANQILVVFKKDANGCKVPEQYNLIQKMANYIGTAVRKYCSNHYVNKTRTLKIVLLASAAALGIKTWSFLKTNPQVTTRLKESFNEIKDGIRGVENGNVDGST